LSEFSSGSFDPTGALSVVTTFSGSGGKLSPGAQLKIDRIGPDGGGQRCCSCRSVPADVCAGGL